MVIVVIRRVLAKLARGPTGVLLILAVSLLVFAFLGIYLSERTRNEDFATLGDSVWCAIVTMSTVGYGDKVPETVPGRIVASVTMISEPILLLSLIGSVAVLIYAEWRRVMTGMSQVVSKGHIIVCGWNPKAQDAINELRLSRKFRKVSVTIIDDRIDAKPIDDTNTTFLHGSPADTGVLQRANVGQAESAIVFAEDASAASDQKTALTVLAIKSLNSSVTTCAELNDVKNEPHLRRAGCDVVVNTGDLTSKLLALSIENSAINEVIEELVSRTHGNEVYRVECPPGYVDRPFDESFPALKRAHNVIVIGVERGEELMINPRSDFLLQHGDFLLVIAEHFPNFGQGS